MAFFTISRVKNLLTAGPGANVRFRGKKSKRNLVDPASRHMLVSKTNSFNRGQISEIWPRLNYLALIKQPLALIQRLLKLALIHRG